MCPYAVGVDISLPDEVVDLRDSRRCSPTTSRRSWTRSTPHVDTGVDSMPVPDPAVRHESDVLAAQVDGGGIEPPT